MADELETTGAEASGAEQTIVPSITPEPSLDDKLGEIWDKNNNVPAHDAKGRFVARQAATEDEPEQELADEGSEPELADEDPDQAQQKDEEPDEREASEDESEDSALEGEARPVIPPPNAWSEPMKAMWDVFPPEMQEYFAKRENDAHQQITRLGRELNEYRPLGKLVTENRDTFLRHGVDPAKGMALLLEAQRRLDMNPGQAIIAIAQQYGVDLAELAGAVGANAQADESGLDPTVKALRNELRQMQRQQAEREQRERLALAQQTQALQQQTDQDVAQWASDKPYYQEAKVRDLMADYIEKGHADSLDEAYDMACNAIPSVRVRIQEQLEREEAEERKRVERQEQEQRRSEARRHASEAKRVTPVNSGTVRRAATVPFAKWDDDRNLERIYDRAQSAR